MGEGCEGRKSGVDSNNKVWAIRKKVELMKIRRYGQYIKVGLMLIIRYGQYIKKWKLRVGKVERQSKSGVCDIIVLATISIVLLHAVRVRVR